MYIRKNAEELRDRLVAYQWSKSLQIRIEGETENENRPLTFAKFAQNMMLKMQENIIDLGLREWVMRNFTTVTETDEVVVSVIFKGAMSKYFNYGGLTGCGIPSVTLMYVPLRSPTNFVNAGNILQTIELHLRYSTEREKGLGKNYSKVGQGPFARQRNKGMAQTTRLHRLTLR
jgi:hypothetical protein